MRPWKDIADQLAKETDPQRITELSDELDRAMRDQLPDSNSPDIKKLPEAAA